MEQRAFAYATTQIHKLGYFPINKNAPDKIISRQFNENSIELSDYLKSSIIYENPDPICTSREYLEWTAIIRDSIRAVIIENPKQNLYFVMKNL